MPDYSAWDTRFPPWDTSLIPTWDSSLSHPGWLMLACRIPHYPARDPGCLIGKLQYCEISLVLDGIPPGIPFGILERDFGTGSRVGCRVGSQVGKLKSQVAPGWNPA